MAFTLYKNWNKIFTLAKTNFQLVLVFILANDDDTLERLARGWPEMFSETKPAIQIPVPASYLRAAAREICMKGEWCFHKQEGEAPSKACSEADWSGVCHDLELPMIVIDSKNEEVDYNELPFRTVIVNDDEFQKIWEQIYHKDICGGMEVDYEGEKYLIVGMDALSDAEIGDRLRAYNFLNHFVLVPAALIDMNA